MMLASPGKAKMPLMQYSHRHENMTALTAMLNKRVLPCKTPYSTKEGVGIYYEDGDGGEGNEEEFGVLSIAGSFDDG